MAALRMLNLRSFWQIMNCGALAYTLECPNEKRILEFQLESVIFLCGEVIEGHMQNLRSLASEMANHTASKVY